MTPYFLDSWIAFRNWISLYKKKAVEKRGFNSNLHSGSPVIYTSKENIDKEACRLEQRDHNAHQTFASSERSSKNSFDVSEVAFAQVCGADDYVVALH